MKKVAVVILNYKVAEQTLLCLQSVKQSSYKNLLMIVVDNHSEDKLAEKISDFPEVIFLQNTINTGYSGGNNLGIKKALEKGADYVFIINPDTLLEKSAISHLVKTAEEGGDIIGPKILFADKKTLWYAGGILDFANVLGKHRGVDEKDQGQYETTGETDFVSGGAMFVKREVFEKNGFFDERYFLYYEDSDFCYRAKKAGFKIIYQPQAIVYHNNAQSTGLGSPLQDYFITRNRLLFASKFLPWRTRLALLREAFNNVTVSARRMALFDFIIGKMGKGSYPIQD